MNYKIKKSWKQPALIRLVRESKEERVLVTCKLGVGVAVVGPDVLFDSCMLGAECDFNCDSFAAS